MKSWSRLPWFLVSRRILACSMTVLRSPTSFWPSAESFFEGELSCFDASAELSATSICLLDGTFPLENASTPSQHVLAVGMWGIANGNHIPWKMPNIWSLALTSASFCFKSTGPVCCQRCPSHGHN
jgi:hypothetical protein